MPVDEARPVLAPPAVALAAAFRDLRHPAGCGVVLRHGLHEHPLRPGEPPHERRAHGLLEGQGGILPRVAQVKLPYDARMAALGRLPQVVAHQLDHVGIASRGLGGLKREITRDALARRGHRLQVGPAHVRNEHIPQAVVHAAAQEGKDLVVGQVIHERRKPRKDEGDAVLLRVGDVAHVLVADDMLDGRGDRDQLVTGCCLCLVDGEGDALARRHACQALLDRTAEGHRRRGGREAHAAQACRDLSHRKLRREIDPREAQAIVREGAHDALGHAPRRRLGDDQPPVGLGDAAELREQDGLAISPLPSDEHETLRCPGTVAQTVLEVRNHVVAADEDGRHLACRGLEGVDLQR